MLAQKLFTLSLALVAALGLGEVATRVFVPDPHYYFENHRELFQEDDRMGYRNAPNVDFYAQGTVHVSTDSLGLREYDTRVNKPDGAIRILGLGDSITWGTGIEKEDTYLHLLGLALNTLGHKESSTFETINAGVIGYSLHQELLFLEHLGLRLKPDVVLVGFAANDAYPTEDPFFNVQRFHQPSKEGVRRRGYSSVPEVDFYFFRFIRTKLRQMRDRLKYRGQGPRGSRPIGTLGHRARSKPLLGNCTSKHTSEISSDCQTAKGSALGLSSSLPSGSLVLWTSLPCRRNC